MIEKEKLFTIVRDSPFASQVDVLERPRERRCELGALSLERSPVRRFRNSHWKHPAPQDHEHLDFRQSLQPELLDGPDCKIVPGVC